jgi:ketosteroid isomerase-like protein
MHTEEVFMLFVTAINRHDLQALTALMTPDHIFIDSLGRRVEGAQSMVAVGEAAGSIDNAPWQTPSAWKAVIREGKVAEWQVFADNKPVYEILARR